CSHEISPCSISIFLASRIPCLDNPPSCPTIAFGALNCRFHLEALFIPISVYHNEIALDGSSLNNRNSLNAFSSFINFYARILHPQQSRVEYSRLRTRDGFVSLNFPTIHLSVLQICHIIRTNLLTRVWSHVCQ